MSVQTRDPPTLLFGQQRSPSPHSFTSQPLSPSHIIAPRSPLPISQPHANSQGDIDMNASITLPPPNGQNHDRDGDTQMDGTEDDDTIRSNESTESGTTESSANPENTMDVAELQTGEMIVNLQNGEVDPDRQPTLEVSNETASEPSQPPITLEQSQPDADVSSGELPHANVSESAAVSEGEVILQAAQTEDATQEQPPSVPAPLPVADHDRMHEDSSDDENEDGVPRWRAIHEDTSVPDEHELKEIEGLKEVSALDHEHWEHKTFTDLDDPEYVPGAVGRITWTIHNYNGTKANPNKELVMRSPVVNIGGYDWRIKFYPRGNESDYLSIYLENLTVAREKNTSYEEKSVPGNVPEISKAPAGLEPNEAVSEATPSEQIRYTPLQLLNTNLPKPRKSVAAQAAVVLYNPDEPRVNYYRSCLHRFSPDSPDWGWTRFHGPWYEIHTRNRGMRQALLRNDTLAFTAYVRIVEDNTACLWEHDSRENPWDSFAMTGLQGLAVPEHPPGGNLISAISSWLLLKPFREFLYQVAVPTFDEQPFQKPKVLVMALQKVLYMQRTQVQPKSGPVGLEDITDALDYYGIDSRIEKLDVVEIWDILRLRIEEELQGTGREQQFEDLFGTPRNLTTWSPSYRAPVKDCGSVQDAVDRANNLLHPTQPPPKFLSIELERQHFDESARVWKKLVNKVEINETITVQGSSYTLYGFVVHKEHLQSGLYYSVLRPSGPSGQWYSFKDGKDENKVVCLTKMQAIEAHQGVSGKPTNLDAGAPVAYIVMYLRKDIAQDGFDTEHEPSWKVSNFIVDEVARSKDMDMFVQERPQGYKSASRWQDPVNDKSFSFQVFDSKLFEKHTGPGVLDFCKPESSPLDDSKLIHQVELKASDTIADIRNKIAVAAAVEPQQCTFWFMDSSPQGSSAVERNPHFVSTGPLEFPSHLPGQDDTFYLGEFKEHCAESKIWLHVSDAPEYLPLPLQTEAEVAIPSTGPDVAAGHIVESEDTLMSDDDDEPAMNQNMGNVVQAATGEDTSARGGFIPPPPVLDTDMSGIPPPPPPGFPLHGSVPPPPPPPPPESVTYQEDMYFFLKVFDAQAQQLVAKGSYMTKKSENILPLVLEKLKLPSDARLNLFEEEDHITCNLISRPQRSFSQNDMQSRCIIIAANILTEAEKAALTDRAAFLDPPAFLEFCAKQRNQPHLETGHFKINYFSSDSYEGAIRNHQRHGHGKHIYFSGDVYVGAHHLSHRHGHGLMTYSNNDTYDGQWVKNQKHGQGTYTESENGNSYTGGWKEDRKFGEGITKWKAAQETERLCRVCWDEPAEAAFYDCGHVVACLGCARGVDICPVCRKRVLGSMKLYFV